MFDRRFDQFLKMPKHWIPLESNPEVLNDFAGKLGVTNISSEYSFCDIFGLDDDLLALVPSPALAVLLLFPITPETEQLRKEGKETPIYATLA